MAFYQEVKAEAALRKARNYTDAAGGILSAPVSNLARSGGISRLPQISKNAPVAEVLIMSTKSVFIGSTLT